MNAALRFLATAFAAPAPPANESLFPSGLPRHAAYEKLVYMALAKKIEVEPPLQYLERECWKIGPPTTEGSSDPLDTNKLIKTLLNTSIIRRKEWCALLELFRGDYEATYGAFNEPEQAFFDRQMKFAETTECDFDSWFAKTEKEGKKETDKRGKKETEKGKKETGKKGKKEPAAGNVPSTTAVKDFAYAP